MARFSKLEGPSVHSLSSQLMLSSPLLLSVPAALCSAPGVLQESPVQSPSAAVSVVVAEILPAATGAQSNPTLSFATQTASP